MLYTRVAKKLCKPNGANQAGADCWRLLQRLEPLEIEIRQGKQVALLREVFAQQYAMEEDGKIEPVKVHATGVVRNPHDPQAEWSAKGQEKQKKEWVGYKVQVPETVPQEERPNRFYYLDGDLVSDRER
jgi:hypothetical protein